MKVDKYRNWKRSQNHTTIKDNIKVWFIFVKIHRKIMLKHA